jgi:hypothetical protein
MHERSSTAAPHPQSTRPALLPLQSLDGIAHCPEAPHPDPSG